MFTHSRVRRSLAGVLAFAACMAIAAPKPKRARAQEPVSIGSFKGRSGGKMTIRFGPPMSFDLTGGVTIESATAGATNSISGDRMHVEMSGAKAGGAADVRIARATGHVRIVNRRKNPDGTVRVTTATGDEGLLDNGQAAASQGRRQPVATLTGNVTVKVDDAVSPMTITNVQKATIDQSTGELTFDPPAGGQVHFEGAVPSAAKGK